MTRQSCENCKQDRKECGNDDHYGFCQNWEYAEQEPCEDAVSRKAVLQAVSEGCFELRGVYGRCEELINALPSVRPQEPNSDIRLNRVKNELNQVKNELEPKTGHWKFVCQHWRKCSECGFSHKFAEDWNYCPNCGAKMVEPQESEDKE